VAEATPTVRLTAASHDAQAWWIDETDWLIEREGGVNSFGPPAAHLTSEPAHPIRGIAATDRSPVNDAPSFVLGFVHCHAYGGKEM